MTKKINCTTLMLACLTLFLSNCKKNEIDLADKDIICMVEPAEEFCEYYLNTVEKIKELLSAKNLVDSLDDEEVNDIMDAFEEMDNHGITLH